MAAYFESGLSVRQPMWHRQGVVLDDYPENWEDARRLAGLEWEPMLVPVYAQLPTGEMRLLETSRAVVRDDSFSDLGVVSDQFELVSHARMGDIMEAILAQPKVKFETAGVVRGGKEVWALAYLDEPFKVKGDDTETLPFLAFLNAHHGQGAAHAVFTNVRVVCWNTYQAALARSKEDVSRFTFHHTAGINDRIEEAKAALRGLRDEVKAWKAVAADLFGMPVDDEGLDQFIAQFLPEPPAPLDPADETAAASYDRRMERMAKARKVFRNLYGGMTVAPHTGTALGLVDASVEFLDYVRQGTGEGRLYRSMLRPDPRRKAEAVTLARRVAR